MDWCVPGVTELSELGAGAQGRVVLGRRPDGSLVAVKYLATDSGGRAEFRREAEILARVENPHVARLLEFVEDDEGAAIVMEAVEGVSLRRLLSERDEALPPEAALTILKGSLLGLAAAHQVEIVHRDFKPANIIVQPDGQSRLIDFGIALLAGEGGRSGTPAYMAPEQWEGAAASPATDVYSATCVFFECVTGRVPYKTATVVQLRAAHLSAPPPIDLVPEPLRPLVEAGLAKTAESRPPAATEFADELELLARETYGPDWQSRGTEALAASAAALSVAFPAAALAAKGLLAKLAAAKFALGGAAVATTAIVIASLLTWPTENPVRPAWRLAGIVPTSPLTAIGDVFAFYGATEGGVFEMIAVEADSGRIRWRAPVNASYTRAASGFGPVYDLKDADNDDAIIFQRQVPGPRNRLVEIVRVDARTGEELWVYGKGGIRVVSEPAWCSADKICLTRRDLESGVENARALDPATGKEVAISQPIDGRELGGGLYASPSLGHIMRITTDGKLVWRRTVGELLGHDLNLNAGWDVSSDGEYRYVLQAAGDATYSTVKGDSVFDYAKSTTVGLDYKTGRLLWREPGTRTDCGAVSGTIFTPVRCRLKGTAVYHGDDDPVDTVTSARIEGYDPATGKSTWTWDAGSVSGFAREDDSILAVDETTYVVRTPSGPFRLDVTKGATPVTGAPAGWCFTTGLLKPAQPAPDDRNGYRHHNEHPCTTAGLTLELPGTRPYFAGDQIGRIFAWADVDGVHAVHAPPRLPQPTPTYTVEPPPTTAPAPAVTPS